MEYAHNGTLEAYLTQKRAAWREAKEGSAPGKEAVSAVRLLIFAFQIASGMEYLSSKDLIHRDLATRNILLSDGLTCKLSDFGLSRDVTGTEQYKQLSEGAVPFRWLALECLLKNKYTTKSDVWSFGVLLWELATLGARPFSDLPVDVIIVTLLSGSRLARPIHCGEELYQMMTSCWHAEPRERPSFAELRRQLDHFLTSDSDLLDMSHFAADLYVYTQTQ